MVDSSERAREIARTYERDSSTNTLITCTTCNSLIDVEYYKTCGVCNTDLSNIELKQEITMTVSDSEHISDECLVALRAMVRVMLPNHTIAVCDSGAIELCTWDPNCPENLLTVRRWSSYDDTMLEENLNAPTR